MGLCKDPTLTFLNKFGYNVVRLPRTGIEPLDVLGRDASLEKLGTLSELLESPATPPAPQGPLSVSDLNGKQTDDLDIAIGLKILADFLGGLASAAGLPSLKLAFKRARSIQFTFTNVVSFTINQAKIGEYLQQARLKENPVNDRFFLNEDTEEFVLFDVLKSDSLTVQAKAEGSAGVELDIPAIQGAVGATVEVKKGSSSQSEIVFKGPQQVTFGFKCFRLEFINGKWRVTGAKAGQDLAFALGDEEDDPVLIDPGARVAIKSARQ
jgi:hypothetical protein